MLAQKWCIRGLLLMLRALHTMPIIGDDRSRVVLLYHLRSVIGFSGEG